MSLKASSNPAGPAESDDLDISSVVGVILRRRTIVLASLTLFAAAALAIIVTARPVYQASSLLLIEKERGGASVAPDGSVVEASNEDYYQTQYKLLKSESLLRDVYDSLKLGTRPEFAPPDELDKLAKVVTITPVLRSRLVYVKVDSFDPSLAADIANTLARTFVSQNLNNQLFISKEVLQALQAKSSTPEGRKLQEGLPAVVNNPLVQQMKADYVKLESQYAQESQRYTARHPVMVSLRSNMAALQTQIQEETADIVQSLKTDLSGQLKGNNVRIVDAATVPLRPISPRKARILAGGILLGLLTGLMMALALDALDQTIRNQQDVETRLTQPFLGMVPLHPTPKGKPVYANLMTQEHSLSGESLRNIRAMIN
ncbi:MAG: hypothetical protein KGR26_15605, partial [Cyanobacteria bacterium REEB65]|nr:hypothetical protein [Cyanobacteria bacterium REEB65]